LLNRSRFTCSTPKGEIIEDHPASILGDDEEEEEEDHQPLGEGLVVFFFVV